MSSELSTPKYINIDDKLFKSEDIAFAEIKVRSFAEKKVQCHFYYIVVRFNKPQQHSQSDKFELEFKCTDYKCASDILSNIQNSLNNKLDEDKNNKNLASIETEISKTKQTDENKTLSYTMSDEDWFKYIHLEFTKSVQDGTNKMLNDIFADLKEKFDPNDKSRVWKYRIDNKMPNYQIEYIYNFLKTQGWNVRIEIPAASSETSRIIWPKYIVFQAKSDDNDDKDDGADADHDDKSSSRKRSKPSS